MHEERRYLPAQTAIEAIAGKPKIVGYAAVYNSLSEEIPLGVSGRKFREIVRPGAFAKSLRSGADVLARYNHQQILGRVSNGSLRLSEDHRGLRFEIDPPNTQYARDLIELIRRRDVLHSSFAFNVLPGGDLWRKDGSSTIREMRAARLLDVAPVDSPAYLETTVALRSFEQWQLDEERHATRRKMRLALAERF